MSRNVRSARHRHIERVVQSGMGSAADHVKRLSEVQGPRLIEQCHHIDCAAAAQAPWVCGKLLARQVRRADPVRFRARLVDLREDGGPDKALRRDAGCDGSPRMPSTVRTVAARRRSLRRPTRMTVGVPWPGMYAPEVSMTSVKLDLVGEVVLDELLAELALHERVRGDLADPAGAFAVLVTDASRGRRSASRTARSARTAGGRPSGTAPGRAR